MLTLLRIKNVMLKNALLVLNAVLWGCSSPPVEEKPDDVITLATTTSTRDSGLLDALLPEFTQQTGIEVKVVAVGSGQALAMGRRGDADVLLTHAPAAEAEFMSAGYGSSRRPVMHNDFVLVGPEAQRQSFEDANSIIDVFQRIAEEKTTFVSRGDDSGTHKKELSLWKQADIAPAGEWYIEAGAGMAQILRIADEKQALTLTDRGTYLSQRGRLDLVVVYENDPLLRNDYTVIVVNPQKYAGVDVNGATRFADFLTAAETQQKIAGYGVEKFGQPLFFPHTADAERPD